MYSEIVVLYLQIQFRPVLKSRAVEEGHEGIKDVTDVGVPDEHPVNTRCSCAPVPDITKNNFWRRGVCDLFAPKKCTQFKNEGFTNTKFLEQNSTFHNYASLLGKCSVRNCDAIVD